MQAVTLSRFSDKERGDKMDGTRDFLPIYSAWYGTPVVLLFVIRQCHIPIPCRILGESVTALRVQIQPGWEVDVRKELILAVEEIVRTPDNCMN
jgi:hypothetical protein